MKKKLLEQKAALVTELDGMVKKAVEENRDFTADEEKREAEIKAEIATLNKQIARVDENDARVAELKQTVGSAQSRHTDPGGSANAGGGQPASGPQAKELFANDAEFFDVIASKRDDQRLAKYRTEQSMGDGTKGGFLVPKEYDNSELHKIQAAPGIVRKYARIIPAGSSPDSEIGFPKLNQSTANADAPHNTYGGVIVKWGNEGAAIQPTDFSVGDINMKPHECTAYIPVTNKLLRNWSAGGGVITGLLNEARAADEDLQFFLGSGVGKPQGVFKSPARVSRDRAGAGDFTWADGKAMVSKLLMRGGRPFWSMSQSVMPKLMDQKDDDDRPVFLANGRDGIPTQYMGYPIEWNERAPLLGTEGDVALLNLGYYWVKEGYGPMVAGSEHVLFLSNKTVFKMGYSVDGQGWMSEKYTQEGGYEVSPFIILK